MASASHIELPSFDTGEYEASELHMSEGKAVLRVHIAGREPVQIAFACVRWHRFTSLYACPAEWISGYYFKVGVVGNSRELAEHLEADQASVKPYKQLHHFRIFLDKTGCHEFLAESADAL
ncbi:hypothetical protein DBR47_22730 [Paucibacter sp. KBW04]|uniref:hypothetical protein n=1 Tax=Paucibacter sp. KBW04 TaxID=2153361 RepID=UPI000F57BA37|nr:hypothetical protein [Paucibacter sp. KBW04]RQO54464.1 hypothetical protein DBR47_22730 [Paucibacter sp. KBW04]